MKNKNYYSIHKNKKKRKSTKMSQLETLKLIHAATELVKAILNMSNSMYGMIPIPKYKLGSNNPNLMIVNDIHKEILYESEKAHIPVELQEYFDPNVTINLPDNIPMNIGYEKNSYQEFKKKPYRL